MKRTIHYLLLLGIYVSYCTSDTGDRGLDDQRIQSQIYLRRYGYLTPEESMVPDSVSNALTELQRRAHIPLTGLIDEETVRTIHKKRCGVPDVFQVTLTSHRVKRFILSETRWLHTDLTYCVESYPASPYTTTTEVDASLARAFKMWGDVSTLTFTQHRHCDVDIVVMFKSGYHGDPTPFDGPGEILAHAYFPGDDGVGLHGDLHFDDDEPWTSNGDLEEREDIFCVAVHEIGHSLGLKHSDIKGAIMWPWARTCTGRGSPLTGDDVRGIQALYGAPNSDTTLRPPPRRTPTSISPQDVNACDGKIDAVTMAADGKVYGFKGSQVYLFERRGVARGYPRDISSVFPGGPRRVTAAVTLTLTVRPGVKDTVTYLISGRNVFLYIHIDGPFTLLKGPVSFSDEFNIPSSEVDTAFVLRDKNTCFFTKGSYFWKMTIDRQGSSHVSPARPLTSIKIIRGIPKFRAALRMPNGMLHFFLNTSFFRVHSQGWLRRRAGPLDTAYWWFGCRHGKPRHLTSSS